MRGYFKFQTRQAYKYNTDLCQKNPIPCSISPDSIMVLGDMEVLSCVTIVTARAAIRAMCV